MSEPTDGPDEWALASQDVHARLLARIEGTPSVEDLELLRDASLAEAVEVVWEDWRIVGEHRYTQSHTAEDTEVAIFVLRHRFYAGGWALTTVEIATTPPPFPQNTVNGRRVQRKPNWTLLDPARLWYRTTALASGSPISVSGLDDLVDEVGLGLEEEASRDPLDRARFPAVEDLRALAALDERDARLDEASRAEVAAMKMLLGLGGYDGIGAALVVD